MFRERWTYHPVTAVDAADNLAVYARLGFPGAIGSVDCTHVRWFRCPALFQNTYSGKEKKATIAYEVTVNHSGRCLHISDGHPGSRNDRTIVKTDKLVMDLKNSKILQDVEYKLFKVSAVIKSTAHSIIFSHQTEHLFLGGWNRVHDTRSIPNHRQWLCKMENHAVSDQVLYK